eukprot:CAMPEP_0184699730 /NCGR_PEP_ID=MMETSP0313-20130426/5885_1 /TAXON_ID=2792 /ORGANISM="Porphyridium aerugineum, Strain SAG 1380-2" /LENGTH=871 /DNA_ID=CAMNT_0027158855 /DNA_START=81 /DNA_END=2696 /DNA_ORIENTATION=+
MEIPITYVCPISQLIMDDPFIDPDGNSYEKEAIMNWLDVKRISPITRNPLEPNQLVPNRALKETIEQFKLDHPEAIGNYRVNPDAMLRPDVVVDAGNPSDPQTVKLDRKPLVLVAVIDVSGSMASMCGQARGTEKDNYTRLDLVKHTLNTIITSLTPEDQICIVKFHTFASVFEPLKFMNAHNQKTLIEKLRTLEPEDSTNIWDGLRLSIDSISGLSADQLKDKNVHIYLLTDGENNVSPPGEMHEVTMNYIKRKCPAGMNPVVSTFGYGSDLDSDMLYSVADACNGGVFGFIPDASLVGTVFVNALSNSLMLGAASDEERALMISDPIISSISEQFASVIMQLLNKYSERERSQTLEAFVTGIREMVQGFDPSLENHAKHKAFLEGMLLDCSPTMDTKIGQIHKAIQDQYFNSWGKHYLRSVMSSYKRLVCINFKDKGMQSFKTARFVEEQQRIGDLFIQLPPPIPAGSRYANAPVQTVPTVPQVHRAAPVKCCAPPPPPAAAPGGCFDSFAARCEDESGDDDDGDDDECAGVAMDVLDEEPECMNKEMCCEEKQEKKCAASMPADFISSGDCLVECEEEQAQEPCRESKPTSILSRLSRRFMSSSSPASASASAPASVSKRSKQQKRSASRQVAVNMCKDECDDMASDSFMCMESSMSVATAPSIVPASMAAYYDADGGCFTADSLVYTPEHDVLRVGDLHPGSYVMSHDGATTVTAIVKLRYTGAMYSVNGSMVLTPYHPVMIGDDCFFPCDLYRNTTTNNKPENVHVDLISNFDGYVYDVVLDNRSILSCPWTVNLDSSSRSKHVGFYVATYGHTMNKDIFAHEYFGDESIVADLKKHPEWNTGVIVIENPKYVRDAVTHRVVELVF